MAHNLRFWPLGKINTRVFQRLSPRNVPTGVEAFPGGYSLLAAALPKAVDWVPVPSQQQIASTLANTVVFLP